MNGPILIFDGGCPFCRHFAELSELKSGIKSLQIKDGRSNKKLIAELSQKGFSLKKGAIVINGDQIFHGAEAIHWILTQMQPSANLLKVLTFIMSNKRNSELLYPLLLQARRIALSIKRLPIDPTDSEVVKD